MKEIYLIDDSHYEIVMKNKKNILVLFDQDEEIKKTLDELTESIENIENTYGFENEPAINLSVTNNDISQIMGTKGVFKFAKDDEITFNFMSRESGDLELPLSLISGGVVKTLNLSDNASLDMQLLETGILQLSNLNGVALGEVLIKNMFQVTSVSIDLSSKANIDLANVLNTIFKAKGIASGLASKENVDADINELNKGNFDINSDGTNILKIFDENGKSLLGIKDFSNVTTQNELFPKLILDDVVKIKSGSRIFIGIVGRVSADLSTIYGFSGSPRTNLQFGISNVSRTTTTSPVITIASTQVGDALTDNDAINKKIFDSATKPPLRIDSGKIGSHIDVLIASAIRGDFIYRVYNSSRTIVPLSFIDNSSANPVISFGNNTNNVANDNLLGDADFLLIGQRYV